MPVVEASLIEVFVYRETTDGRKYLLMKRSSSEIYPGIWSVCAGSIERDEKTLEAAVRELHEETGLIPEAMYAVDTVNIFYEPIEDKMHIVPVFLARVSEPDIVLSDEHSEYVWTGLEESGKLLHWVSHKNNIRLIDKCLGDGEYFKTLKQLLPAK